MPYTFAITAGSLPPGLTLDADTGVVSGEPTTPGSYPYTITVTNDDGDTISNACTITVAAAPGATLQYEDPCRMTGPLVWTAIQDKSGAIRLNVALRQAIRDRSTVYGGYKAPRVLSAGPVTRSASDWLTRAWSAQKATITLPDTDRRVVNLPGLDSLKESTLYYYLTSQSNRINGGLPRLLFQGPIYADQQGDFQRQVTANDVLGVLYDLFSGVAKCPKRTVGTGDFAGAPNASVGKPVAIIGGKPTDANNTLGGGADNGTPGYGGQRIQGGAVPGLDIGNISLGGVTGRGVLFGGHALQGYDYLFLLHPNYVDRVVSYLDGAPRSDGIPLSDWGSKVKVPGYGGWPSYFDINGNRYSIVLFTDATYIDKIANQGFLPRANVRGATTNPDGSGTLIESVGALCEWLVLNWLIGDYRSGAWLTTPQFELFPGSGVLIDRVDHASFVAADGVASSLLIGGLKGAFVIGVPTLGQSTAQQVLQNALLSWNLMLRWNQYNQLGVKMLDRRRSVTIGTQRSLTWQHDVLSNPRFKLTLKETWFFNGLAPLVYEPIYADTDVTGGASAGNYFSGQQLSRPASQNAYGVVNKDRFALPYVFDHQTANVVGNQLLDFASQPRWLATWAQSLCGLKPDILDAVPMTHYAGRGVNGWANRGLWIMDQTFYPESMTVQTNAVDIDDLLT